MSKNKFDSDGFQIITRNSKNKAAKVPKIDVKFSKQEIRIDVEKVHKRIQSCIEDLRGSLYFKQVANSVSNILQERNVVEIVCLGLGHIGECNISQYQLALLLCLKEFLKPKTVFVHDPIFYTSECLLLKDLNLSVIKENNEGNYIISREGGVTLVYLPHCPKQLTNNFLWSNWGLNLENCILTCNSFASLFENQPSRILKELVPYIVKLFPLTSEVVLENSFVYKDIFNDTSLHYFLKNRLESVPLEFWIKQNKPNYDDSEEFITSLMIDKLTI